MARELDNIDRLVEQEDRAARLHQERLSRHPDCVDPAHPGCDRCSDEDDDDE